MAGETALKAGAGNCVWVRIPPGAPIIFAKYFEGIAMSLIDNNIFVVTKNDQFIIDDESPALPVDKNGIPIRIGDLLLLKHNGKHLRVRLMHYCGDGIWHIFGYGGG